MTDLGKLMEWFTGSDTGTSSKCIAAVMCGADPEKIENCSHPYDPADLGRCLRLLEIFPEWKARMPEMANVSDSWALAAKHWNELATLFEKEVGIHLEKGHRAGLTYKRMKQIGL